MAIGGPCVIFAPLVFVVFVLALPFWPIAIVLLALAWCVTWPLERAVKALGGRALGGWSAHVAYWLLVSVKPWYFFDPIPVRAARRARFGIVDAATPAPDSTGNTTGK